MLPPVLVSVTVNPSWEPEGTVAPSARLLIWTGGGAGGAEPVVAEAAGSGAVAGSEAAAGGGGGGSGGGGGGGAGAAGGGGGRGEVEGVGVGVAVGDAIAGVSGSCGRRGLVLVGGSGVWAAVREKEGGARAPVPLAGRPRPRGRLRLEDREQQRSRTRPRPGDHRGRPAASKRKSRGPPPLAVAEVTSARIGSPERQPEARHQRQGEQIGSARERERGARAWREADRPGRGRFAACLHPQCP